MDRIYGCADLTMRALESSTGDDEYVVSLKSCKIFNQVYNRSGSGIVIATKLASHADDLNYLAWIVGAYTFQEAIPSWSYSVFWTLYYISLVSRRPTARNSKT